MPFIFDERNNVLSDTRKPQHINLSAPGGGKMIERTLNEQQDVIDELNDDIRQLTAMLNDTESQLIYQLESMASRLKARGRG